eukprot:1770809-Rhodomonas_salina.2
MALSTEAMSAQQVRNRFPRGCALHVLRERKLRGRVDPARVVYEHGILHIHLSLIPEMKPHSPAMPLSQTMFADGTHSTVVARRPFCLHTAIFVHARQAYPSVLGVLCTVQTDHVGWAAHFIQRVASDHIQCGGTTSPRSGQGFYASDKRGGSVQEGQRGVQPPDNASADAWIRILGDMCESWHTANNTCPWTHSGVSVPWDLVGMRGTLLPTDTACPRFTAGKRQHGVGYTLRSLRTGAVCVRFDERHIHRVQPTKTGSTTPPVRHGRVAQ